MDSDFTTDPWIASFSESMRNTSAYHQGRHERELEQLRRALKSPKNSTQFEQAGEDPAYLIGLLDLCLKVGPALLRSTTKLAFDVAVPQVESALRLRMIAYLAGTALLRRLTFFASVDLGLDGASQRAQRTLALLPFVIDAPELERSGYYLARVATCYVSGLDLETYIMVGAVIDTLLEDNIDAAAVLTEMDRDASRIEKIFDAEDLRFRESPWPPNASLRAKAALSSGLLSPNQYKDCRLSLTLRNNAVHGNADGRLTRDPVWLLETIIPIVSHLATAQGGA